VSARCRQPRPGSPQLRPAAAAAPACSPSLTAAACPSPPPPRCRYAFDLVFDAAASNAQVFQAIGHSVVIPALTGARPWGPQLRRLRRLRMLQGLAVKLKPRPCAPARAAGVNGTIFAYGVTSSGKTHTMMVRAPAAAGAAAGARCWGARLTRGAGAMGNRGPLARTGPSPRPWRALALLQGCPGDAGVVPRVVQEVFEHVRTMASRTFSIKMSIMEIYNEVGCWGWLVGLLLSGGVGCRGCCLGC
jgi:hypothetical protein